MWCTANALTTEVGTGKTGSALKFSAQRCRGRAVLVRLLDEAALFRESFLPAKRPRASSARPYKVLLTVQESQ